MEKICKAEGTDEFGDWKCRKSSYWKDGGKGGFCAAHYRHWKLYGETQRVGVQAMINRVCRASGQRADGTIWECLAPNEGKHVHGLCNLHHKQAKAGNGLTENSGDAWNEGTTDVCQEMMPDGEICGEPTVREDHARKRRHRTLCGRCAHRRGRGLPPMPRQRHGGNRSRHKPLPNKDMICEKDGCGRPVHARALNGKYYCRKHRSLERDREHIAAGELCEAPPWINEFGEERHCGQPWRARGTWGDGEGKRLCASHYSQNENHGVLKGLLGQHDNKMCRAGEGKGWECGNEAVTLGVCETHQNQFYDRGRDMSKLTPIWKPEFTNKICRAKGKDREGEWKCGNRCGYESGVNYGGAKGLCGFHYDHHYVRDTPLDKLPRYRPRPVAVGDVKIKNSLRPDKETMDSIMANPNSAYHHSIVTWWKSRKWDVAAQGSDVSYWSGRPFIMSADKRVRKGTRTLEHVVPIRAVIPHAMKWPAWKKRQFKYDIRNIVPAVHGENTAKSNRMPQEWLDFVYEDGETGEAVKYVTRNKGDFVRRWQAVCITYGLDDIRLDKDDPLVVKHCKGTEWRKMWAGALVESAKMRVRERKRHTK